LVQAGLPHHINILITNSGGLGSRIN